MIWHFFSFNKSKFEWIMKKVFLFSIYYTGLRNRSKRVRTPVALLRSLSDKYPWKNMNTLILPAMGEIVSLLFF